MDQNCDDSRFDHALGIRSDEELEKIVRQRAETLYHPTSTCRMAPFAEKGVVDSQLRVYGIKGLRVCDASIFPTIISGHTVSVLLASHRCVANGKTGRRRFRHRRETGRRDEDGARICIEMITSVESRHIKEKSQQKP